MSGHILNMEALTVSCDRCHDGRHWRCGGRNGCECSVCRTTINKRLRKQGYGHSTPHTRNPTGGLRKPRVVLTEAQKDEALERCKRGETQTSVARSMSVHPSTINALVRRSQ